MNDSPSALADYGDRRSGFDRRKERKPIITKYWLKGRRAKLRREGDRQRPYQIDRHDLKTLAAILVIIALSTLDAVFTLLLTSNGAVEVNPLMAYFLDRSPVAFFGVKYSLTCACILFILPIKGHYLFRTKIQGKSLIILSIVSFALIIQWELYLILFGS